MQVRPNLAAHTLMLPWGVTVTASSSRSHFLPVLSCIGHCMGFGAASWATRETPGQPKPGIPAGLRAPKREWEGATLRNGETLCNNLLPLRAAQVSDTAHAAAVASFMANLSHAPQR